MTAPAADLRILLTSSRAELRHGCARMLDLLTERAHLPARLYAYDDTEVLTYAATFTRAVLEFLDLGERLEPRPADTLPMSAQPDTLPPPSPAEAASLALAHLGVDVDPADLPATPCGSCEGSGIVLEVGKVTGESYRAVCLSCHGVGCT